MSKQQQQQQQHKGNEVAMQRYREQARSAPYMSKIESPNYKFENSFLDGILKEIPVDGNFLDVGCATAPFLDQLIARAKVTNRNDVKFFAFDYNEDFLKIALEKKLDAEIFFDDLKNPTSQQLQENKFDYVFSKDVVFFFSDEERESVFKNLKNFLKPQGILNIQIRKKKDGVEVPDFNDFTQEEIEDYLKKNELNVEISIIGKKIPYGKSDPEDPEANLFERLIVIAKARKLELENDERKPGKAPASPESDQRDKKRNPATLA